MASYTWLATFAFILSLLSETNAGKLPPPWAQAHGVGKFDGDIVMDSNLLARAAKEEGWDTEGGREEQARNIIKGQSFLWPGGVVPYVINSIFDYYAGEKQTIINAIYKINSYSCVRFIPRTSEPYYISFNRGTGCSSHVGRQQMAAQPVAIGQGCAKIGTIIHELLHVVGFFHTSSRHDRNSYVNVFLNNVISGYEHNFWIMSQDKIDPLGAPYDKDSIMQPHRLAWSKNGLSTVESKRMPSEVLGRVDDDMSPIDVTQLNALYNCPNTRNCFARLGMQDGRISDYQLTASSYLRYYEPHQARLQLLASSKGLGAWCANQNHAQGEWLQIDFGSVREIRGIATQGVDSFTPAWVQRYTLQYSTDGSWWSSYSSIWPYGMNANVDENSAQYNTLPHKISAARYLRILPTHWYNQPCMRLEVYGC